MTPGAVRVDYVPLASLRRWSRNPKLHDLKELRRSIVRFGFVQPLVEDATTGRLVAGHGRLDALLSMRQAGESPPGRIVAKNGDWLVPVLRGVSFKDEREAEAYLIADNKLVELGGWDDAALATMLKDLSVGGAEVLDGTGWTEHEVAKFVGEVEGEAPTKDAAPKLGQGDELRQKWGVETGQLWAMGGHRLLCGDSTSPEAVKRLLVEDCDICFTSPPYGLGTTIRLRNDGRESPYVGDADDPAKWPDLMRRFIRASVGHVGCWIINVQMLTSNKRNFVAWLNEQADRLIDIAIWDKLAAGPAYDSGVLTSRFEFVVILGKEGANRKIPFSSWRGTVNNVYAASAHHEHVPEHGAVMPLHLPLWAIGTLCDEAKTVYEPFGGTGTTIVACEQLHRRCFAIEISPVYVSIALQRFFDATGVKPTVL